MRGVVMQDGPAPRRFSGVRLPAATPQEEAGYPVVVLDASGVPMIYSAAEWRATHADARCPHGYRHCFACRHRLTSHTGALPAPAYQTDAALLAAIAG